MHVRRILAAVSAAALVAVSLALGAPLSAAAAVTVSATVPVSGTPSAIVASPNSNVVFVGRQNAVGMAAIDTVTGTVVGTASLDGTVNALAVSPDGNTVYATVNGDYTAVDELDAVDVSDPTNPHIAWVKVIGDYSTAVAASPDGSFVLATLYNNNAVAKVSTAAGHALTTIPVGTTPTHIAFQPGTDTAWVSFYGNTTATDGGVSVIAPDNTVTTIKWTYFAQGIGFTSDGSYAYVASWGFDGNGYVERINTSTHAKAAIAVSLSDAHDVVVTGSEVYVGGSAYGLAYFATGSDTPAIHWTPTTTDTTELLALSPVGDQVFAVPNNGGSHVGVVQTQTHTVVNRAVGNSPGGVAVTYDGSHAAVTNSADNTVTILTTGEALTAPDITTTTLSPATEGATYGASITATGTPTPTLAVTTGSLPDGLTLGSDGTLSGTPTEYGSFTFTVTATNSLGSDDQEFTLAVNAAPTIDTVSLADAQVGLAYDQTVIATGSPSPTLSSTDLPAWLSLNPATGELTGTPTAGGAVTFTVTASNGVMPDASHQFTIGVRQAPTITTTSLPDATVGEPYSATLVATGYPAPTFLLTGTAPVVLQLGPGAVADAAGLPTGVTLNSSTGVLSGTPTQAGTYDFGIIATNDAGGVSRNFEIVVAAAAPLASTGVDPLLPLAIAVGVLLLGGAALLVARLRRRGH